MNNNSDLDDKLAAFTDRLLNQELGYPADLEPGEAADLEELTQVVRQLRATIQPEAPDDPVYRARLRQVLLREWETWHGHSKWQGARWLKPRGTRLAVLAAALAVILIVGALLVPGGQSDSNTAQGTVSGSAEWVLVLTMGLLCIGIFAVWFIQRRKRK